MRQSLFAPVMILTRTTLPGQTNQSGDWQATVHSFRSAQYTILHLQQTGENVGFTPVSENSGAALYLPLRRSS